MYSATNCPPITSYYLYTKTKGIVSSKQQLGQLKNKEQLPENAIVSAHVKRAMKQLGNSICS